MDMMKVYCEYEPNESGKGQFLGRLMRALPSVKFTANWKNADVALGFTRWRTQFAGLPLVLRIDGIYLQKHHQHEWNNKRIRKSIDKSDVVVFQSGFAKKMVEGMFGNAKKSLVIFNGADAEDYDVPPAQSYFKKNIIMSSKWSARDSRSHKRLDEALDYFKKYLRANPDTKLWIAGRTKKKYEDSLQMQFLGHLDSATLAQYLKLADVFVHIPWYSWCDNAVVEAIAAGCSVVSSNNGGNAELVKQCNGIIVETDEEMVPGWQSKEIPAPDLSHMDKAMSLAWGHKMNTKPIDIYNIAKQYVEAFECALSL